MVGKLIVLSILVCVVLSSPWLELEDGRLIMFNNHRVDWKSAEDLCSRSGSELLTLSESDITTFPQSVVSLMFGQGSSKAWLSSARVNFQDKKPKYTVDDKVAPIANFTFNARDKSHKCIELKYQYDSKFQTIGSNLVIVVAQDCRDKNPFICQKHSNDAARSFALSMWSLSLVCLQWILFPVLAFYWLKLNNRKSKSNLTKLRRRWLESNCLSPQDPDHHGEKEQLKEKELSKDIEVVAVKVDKQEV
ncbi:hypothetical protein HDE_06922 [Halotydeus destructor]|nr:hypothetical protein HDE_06922 [Halotydeus destructor]